MLMIKIIILIGNLSETLGDIDRAVNAYDSALRHNPYSITALTQIASIFRGREQYVKVYFLLSPCKIFTSRPLNFFSVFLISKATMVKRGVLWAIAT
jgi:hypothetical protein